MKTKIITLLVSGFMVAASEALAAPGQSYAVLHAFTGGSDGANPYAGLLLANDTLYGTTCYGGSSNHGVIYRLSTDGSGYTVLRSFSGSDGANPYAGLVLVDGTLYGTTCYGGNSNNGVIFKLNTDGSGYTVLRSFSRSDGANPRAGLVLANGTLYGTTASGGDFNSGAVFKVGTNGTGFGVLKSFSTDAPGGNSDGASPYGGLALAGRTLYGTTASGGSSFHYGGVFKVNTDGSGFAALKLFNGADGFFPEGNLTLASSTLYGITPRSAAVSWNIFGHGTVFKISTNGSGYAVLRDFTGDDGHTPHGGLVLAGSTLYGTTQSGGHTYQGEIFEVNTDGSGFAILKSFTGEDGEGPFAPLILANRTLFGTTWSGGSSGVGVVFSGTLLSIAAPPLTQTTETGSTPSFRVRATSLSPGLAYQWYVNGTNAMPRATNAWLELPNVQPSEAGAYSVVVTNSAEGAVTSAPALLSVIPPVSRRVVPALGLRGGPGSLPHLEYADFLAPAAPQWLSLSNVIMNAAAQLCFDLSQPLAAQRFYRGWQTNGLPAALNLSLVTEIPLTGAIGSSVRIDSINATGPTNAWVTLDTVLLTNSTQLYFDLTAFQQPTRLYRLVVVP